MIEQSNHLLSLGKPVRDDVDHDDSDAQRDGHARREALGVEDPHDVVLDETSLVTLLPSQSTKVVLERCERTDPAHEFDHGSVNRDGKVNPRELLPSNDEKSSEDDEENKREVRENHSVGRTFNPAGGLD